MGTTAWTSQRQPVMSLKTVGASFVGICAVSVAVASIWMHPAVSLSGLLRPVENLNTDNCRVESALQACEKMILHEPSGNLYLSCSDPMSRVKWTPALARCIQAKSPPETDYFAVVDTSLNLSPNSYKKIKLSNLPTTGWRGLNLVGLDVVASETDPDTLWVYAVNHRPPLPPATAAKDGADSCVEIFRTRLGSDSFEYVKTVEDPQHIITPNDVIGKSDGSGFWVSNDHSVRVGMKRQLETFFIMEGAGIAYCSLRDGCKFAITGLPGINGIARASPKIGTEIRKKDMFYGVGYAISGKLFIMDRQSDDSLVLAESLDLGYSLDNIHVDSDGSVYIAAIPRPLDWLSVYMADPTKATTPSAVIRVSVDPMAFYGGKYKVEKIFENNGTIISGATTAVWDKRHGSIWLHGLASMGLVSCKI